MGFIIEVYYYEVGIVGQCEIGVGFNSLVYKVDEVQILKYCVYNVVYVYGKMVIFMFKFLVGDNGFGMYVYQFLVKDGKNLFVGDEYVGLFKEVLYYIGGIIKYVCVINVFINVFINLYKCLVFGFEVFVMLVYLVCNCLVFICIFWVSGFKVCCVEVCFLDFIVNLYLGFVVMLMVGFDGIKNKIYFGDVVDKDLYDLLVEEVKVILMVFFILMMFLDVLEVDKDFLMEGGVFIQDMIEGYVDLKCGEVEKLNMIIYLVEFEMYYFC